jgi:hypothetical protein
MNHPREDSLALYAGGELGLLARWKVGRHVAGCDECGRSVSQFRSAREQLLSTRADLPPGVNWNRQAEEMTANIHVGLAAGECVGAPASRILRPRWHKAVILAPVIVPLLALLVIGVWFVRPRPQASQPQWVDGIVIQATAEAIELRQGDRMLSLRHPSAGDVTVAANAQGTVRARYVDPETGQVTIHNVSAQ